MADKWSHLSVEELIEKLKQALGTLRKHSPKKEVDELVERVKQGVKEEKL